LNDRLRVVISSANLTAADWFLMEQQVWFQDFARANQSTASDTTIKQPTTERGKSFLKTLLAVLASFQNVPKGKVV
jgi:hypothetical protein